MIVLGSRVSRPCVFPLIYPFFDENRPMSPTPETGHPAAVVPLGMIADEPAADIIRLTDWSLGQCAPEDLQRLSWAPDFSFRQQGKISLRAAGHRFRAAAEVRTVEIVGPKLAIVNLFSYPTDPMTLPIFAMELVRFGERGVVGVMDLKWVGPRADAPPGWARAALREVRDIFPGLPEGDDPPGWYQECRSGDDLFLRPESRADFAGMIGAYRFLWGCYLAHLSSDEECGPASVLRTGSRAVAAYKDHHRIHSPGLPFLQKTFGVDWTEAFLKDCYFR